MRFLAVVIVVSSLFVFSCANGDVPVAGSPEPTVPPTDTEAPGGTARDVVIDSPASGSAFASNPLRLEGRARTFENNVMGRSGGDCARVYPVNRRVPATVSMARLLIEALIQGPTESEKAAGFSFDFPLSGRVESIALRDGTLTIDFTSDLQNVGGSCRVQAIRASIEETILRLPTVDRVRILAGGSEELALQP